MNPGPATSIAENAGSSLTLTATSSIDADEDITVTLTTSGTGTEGTDYSTISDITISAGDTTGTASFTPTDDSVYEGNETGIVAIASVSPLVKVAEPCALGNTDVSISIFLTVLVSLPSALLLLSRTFILKSEAILSSI